MYYCIIVILWYCHIVINGMEWKIKHFSKPDKAIGKEITVSFTELDWGFGGQGGGVYFGWNMFALYHFLSCLKHYQLFFWDGFWPPADPSQPAWMDKSNNFFYFFLKPSTSSSPLNILIFSISEKNLLFSISIKLAGMEWSKIRVT